MFVFSCSGHTGSLGLSTTWKKGILLAFSIFTVGGLILIAKTDYGRLTSNLTHKIAQEHSNKNLSTAQAPQSNYNHTARLFGLAMKKPKEIAPEQLPETRLNLILKGTFTHEESDKASALIAENNKNTARFFVGDEIAGSAKLIAIRKGEITLRRNGQDELLRLPYLKENNLKVDERVARSRQRQAFSANKANSLAKNSQIKSSKNTRNENTNNSRQQQLKDRLARLRNNNSNE